MCLSTAPRNRRGNRKNKESNQEEAKNEMTTETPNMHQYRNQSSRSIDQKNRKNQNNEKAQAQAPEQEDQDNQKSVQTKKARTKSVIYMTLAMAVHFAGHEFLRSPTMSLFTSKEMGWQSSAVLPLAVGLVSPFSVFLLWTYTKSLQRFGPRYALTRSTTKGAIFMLVIGVSLYTINYQMTHIQNIGAQRNNESMMDEFQIHSISKYLLFALFVFQSANVQFLYTQHWSFIGSILSPDEVARSGSLIAGIGSITSTLAAAYVSHLVDRIGLIGSQCTAALIIGSSGIFAKKAYQIANQHGFEPKHDRKKQQQQNFKKIDGNDEVTEKNTNSSKSDDSMIKSSMELFKRVPILGAMFCEVIISQCLSSLLNFQFVNEVKNSILDDKERAGWTGNCYAWVNGVSGALQFFILPFVVKRIGPRWLWLTMPLIMLVLTSIQFYAKEPSLSIVGLTFLTMKTIEYSIRGQASEMVWVKLDYESRFIGKELINLFANRLGKSTTAVLLFVLSMQLEKDGGTHLRHISIVACNLLAILWLFSAMRLARMIPS
mmetsp:Transcript_15056/g.18361  ORF Transcript_15056/g.18361 Transcript_15056/m.18361 type:complete len:545 (+) Transcript_15056:231-1865(+)